MTSNMYLISFYLISLFLFLNFSSSFTFWILIEFNLIMFISFCLYVGKHKDSQEMNDVFLFYFIIQSFASSFFLFDFFFLSEVSIFHFNYFFFVSMLIKLGVFPFFFWIFKIRDFVDSFFFSILLSLQKLPFFLVLFFSNDFLLLITLVSSFIVGSILILFSKDFKFMLICSSISYSFWTVYLYLISSTLFIFFYILYGLFLWLLLNSMEVGVGVSSIFPFMFFLGLSPLSLFFLKFLAVGFILFSLGQMEIFIFLIFSFMLLFGYMKFFHTSMYLLSDLYKYIKIFGNKMLLISLTTSIFCGFLL